MITPSFASRKLAVYLVIVVIFVLSYLSFRDDSPGAGYLTSPAQEAKPSPVPKPVLAPEPSSSVQEPSPKPDSSVPESSSVPALSQVPEPSPLPQSSPVPESLQPETGLTNDTSSTLTIPSRLFPSCGNETHADARRLWFEADARYSTLMDDKFTIVMPTYKRPEILNKTLSMIANATIPSLHEVVIMWNDIESSPPEDFTSSSGLSFRYHVPEKNSLNNRFMPLPSYATQAILHSDDDIGYDPADIEFTIQVWRQHGRYRITGPFPRCHGRNAKDNNRLFYSQCKPWYSMILTGMAFVHISVMDFYSSSHPIPTQIREYVDDKFNCEDLAMNFLASIVTCDGPLHVSGEKEYVFWESKPKDGEAEGLSKKPDHWGNRGRCMAHFEDVIGFFPLVEQVGSIQRGVSVFW